MKKTNALWLLAGKMESHELWAGLCLLWLRAAVAWGSTALVLAIYNWVAKRFGGIKVIVERETKTGNEPRTVR